MAPKVKSNKANAAVTPTATTKKEAPKKSKSDINLAKLPEKIASGPLDFSYIV